MSKYEIIKFQDLKNEAMWQSLHDNLYKTLINGVEVREVRRKEMEFQFTDNGHVFALPLINLITNIKIWKCYAFLVDEFTDYHILDCTKLDMGQIKDYIDTRVVLPYRKIVTNKEMNLICARIMEELKEMAEFSDILGINMSVYDEIEYMKKNDKYRDLITMPIKKGATQGEIDEFRYGRTKEIIKLIKSDITHPLNAVMVAGEGISIKQFTEGKIAVGSKPDGDGYIYPKTIRTNYFAQGVESISEYFVEATSGMNAKILSAVSTGDAGYYSRQVGLLNTDTLLHPEREQDCGNNKPIEYFCGNRDLVDRIKFRYYKNHPSDKDWKVVKYKDWDLIGKIIYLRSAINCACEDYICWKCYGDLAYVNSDIHVGLLGACIYTEGFTQKILSAKHLFSTNFKGLNWSEGFKKSCTMYSNVIGVDLEKDEKAKVVIKQEDYHIESKIDKERLGLTCDRFYVHKGGEVYECYNKEDIPFYFTNYMFDMVGEDLYQTSYDIEVFVDSDNYSLFLIDIETIQLSQTFLELESSTNNLSNIAGHTYQSLFIKLRDLLVKGGVRCDSIHMELIIRNLLRDPDKVIKRPDFANLEEKGYQILTVKKALHKNPSIGISLAFDSQSMEFKNPLIFERTKPSLIDPLLRPTISKPRGDL